MSHLTTLFMGISISQRRLRELDDPIQKFLVLLHKIIYITQVMPTLPSMHHPGNAYITQLPPAPYSSSRRRLVERFKKSLFHQDSSALSLKVTLSKVGPVDVNMSSVPGSPLNLQVLQGSSEPVELGSPSSDWWPQSLSIKAPLYGPQNQGGHREGVGGEQILRRDRNQVTLLSASLASTGNTDFNLSWSAPPHKLEPEP
ncbi:Serine/threonine-protein kinase Nek10 [Merluccius polli]|uniref:Serine/threonine-protein kinase Nek10 n=1 Tax=Merluccius polli TaxID=89951 RepID=A0AA47N1M1_MERPO|nr:Serine/threonine-protein kinase Nek10 [Merluccius polli]